MTLICKTISCDSTEQAHSNVYPPAKWDNYANKHSYNVYLTRKLGEMAHLKIVDDRTIQSQIDSYIRILTR